MKPNCLSTCWSLFFGGLLLAQSTPLGFGQVTCPEEPPSFFCPDDEEDCDNCLPGGGEGSNSGFNSLGGGNSNLPSQNPCSTCPSSTVAPGMAAWSVVEPNLILQIVDQPLGYRPALGRSVAFRLSHVQAWAIEDGYSDDRLFGFGTNWYSSFQAFIKDNGGDSLPSNLYFQGRKAVFTLVGSEVVNFEMNARLVRQLSNSITTGFELTYRTGAKEVFKTMVNGFSPLTKRVDPRGKEIVFNYDTNLWGSTGWAKLLSITDADTRTTSLNYANTNFPKQVTSVSDPFSRNANLSYDSNGKLTNIVDPVGLGSQFVYDGNNYITNMVTPYGTTVFKLTKDSVDHFRPGNYINRAIEVTEPTGGKHLFMYREESTKLTTNGSSAILLPASYAAAEVPQTTNGVVYSFANKFDNSYNHLRNSYHWGPLQFDRLSTSDMTQFTTNDYKLAHRKHWLQKFDLGGESGGFVTLALALEQLPSPDGTAQGQKIWYDHDGKSYVDVIGTQALPLFRALVLPNGETRFTRYERNTYGFPTAEKETYTKPDGTVGLRTTSLTYGSNNIDLVKINDAAGNQIVSNRFNAFHQVATNYNAASEYTLYTYNGNQQLIRIQYPSGLTRTNIYFPSGTFINWLDRTIDIGFRTNCYTYVNGLVQTFKDELETTITNYWDNLQRLTGRQFWDQTTSSNIFYKRDNQPFSGSTGGTNLLDLTGTKDRLGNWTYFGLDAMRRKTAETNARGYATLFDYCDCGSLSALRYPTGNTNTYAYDNLGRLTNSIISLWLGKRSYSYNLLGQLVTETDGVSTRTHSYNNHGLLSSSSNPNGQLIAISCDILDRPTNVVDASGVTTTNSYDALGRVLVRGKAQTNSNEQFFYSPNIAGPTSYINALGYTNSFAYDALGRKTNEAAQGVSTISFTYEAASNLKTLLDGNNRLTTWSYDKDGQLHQKTDATSATYTYTYYPTGWLSNRVDSLSRATSYDYDGVGNLTGTRYITLGTTNSYSYDAENRLVSVSDATGTTALAHAWGGEYSAQIGETGPWPNTTVSGWAYTEAMLYGGYRIYMPNGSPIDVIYGTPSATRFGVVYDLAGTISSYTYLGAGNSVKTLTFSSNGASITNSYDGLARLTETRLKQSGGTSLNLHQYTYSAANQRTSQTRSEGSAVDYTYDTVGQLIKAAGHHGTTNRWHEQLGYGYDPAGNLTKRTNNALVQVFAPSNLNQLTNVNSSGTLTVAGTTSAQANSVSVNSSTNYVFLYADNTFAATNRTITTSYTAVASDTLGRSDTNTVTINLSTNVNLTYDLNGNQTGDGRRAFAYDQENQLTSVTVTNAVGNSTKTAFVYDGLMRVRIRYESNWVSSAWVKLSETRYLYDGRRVVQERDGNNLPSVTYIWGVDLSGTLTGAGGIGGLLARIDHGTGTTAYYHADGNGNVTMLINQQQVPVAKYSYDSFGNVLAKSGPLAEANTYRFSSKESHATSGLVYYGFRFYDANLQRWLNRDPIEEAGGINLYGFVGNNPLNFIDPDGEYLLPAAAIVILLWIELSHPPEPQLVFKIEWCKPLSKGENERAELEAMIQRIIARNSGPSPSSSNPLPVLPAPSETIVIDNPHSPHAHEPEIEIPPRPPLIRLPRLPQQDPFIPPPQPPKGPPRDTRPYRGGPSRGRVSIDFQFFPITAHEAVV